MAKEPIWAIDASYQLDDHVLQLVVVPIFTRSDVPIIGRDLALAPPGTDLETQIRTAASVHPSIEDQIGDGFAGTEIPEESLWNSSVAFRATSNLGGWDLGATVGWIWDRNPTIYLDDDLRGLLASGVNLLGLMPAVTLAQKQPHSLRRCSRKPHWDKSSFERLMRGSGSQLLKPKVSWAACSSTGSWLERW